jgi:undecaprenyl-diphosphatase
MNGALIGALMIQLIFESLPVSSSGHVFLFTSLYPCPLYATWEGMSALPTICIILIFFRRSWWPFTRLLGWRLLRYGRLHVASGNLIVSLALYNVMSVCLAVISYGLLKSMFPGGIVGYFLPYGFFVTMMLLFSLRVVPHKNASSPLTWYYAFIIGCVQALALLPGVSRLAATYVTCRCIGLSSRRSLEYSWCILMPLLCAAFLRDCISVYRSSGLHPLGILEMSILVGGVVLEWFFLKLTCRMAAQNRLSLFGYYMIIPLILSMLCTR